MAAPNDTSTLVLPVHDPNGILLMHLQRILPTLVSHFQHAFISLSPQTVQQQEELIGYFRQNHFFSFVNNAPGSTIGDHYLAGYHIALERCQPETQLHLCDPAR